jgi:hypothetical protein
MGARDAGCAYQSAAIIRRSGPFGESSGTEHSALHEIDLNPVFAYPAGALAVDVRILLA